MIGPVVKQWRLQRKLSQEALAAAAHVSSGYLSKLERGIYKAPSGDVIRRIAEALSVTPAELYKAAGMEDFVDEHDPLMVPFLADFGPKLNHLPKRDRDIILGEVARILRDEKSEGNRNQRGESRGQHNIFDF